MDLVAHDAKPGSGGKDVQVLHVDPDVALGYADDVFIVVWRNETTIQGVATLTRLFRTFSRSRRSIDAALVTVIEPKAKMPAPGSREMLARFLSDASKTVAISGVAFEGDGFLAASIRGVVVGLTLLARQPFPHRVFATVGEVSEWMESEHSRISKHFNARAIQNTVAMFRTQVHRKSSD